MRGKGFGTPLSVRPIDEQLDVIHSLYNRRKSTENIHRNRETLSPRPSNALSQFNKNNLIGREFSTIEVKKQEIPESSRNRKECASMQMQRSKSRGMHNLDMGYPTRKKYSVAKEMNRDIARYANKVHRKTQRGEKVVTAYLTNIHDNNTIRKFIKRDNVQDLFGMFKFKTLPSVYKDHHGNSYIYYILYI